MMVRSLVTVAFLSTLSLRRATRKTQRPYVKDSISIHALLAESDTTGCPTDTSLKAFLSTLSLRRATSLFCPLPYPYRYFYPRSPCGERLTVWPVALAQLSFLSTLSLRRATYPSASCRPRAAISIHALLAESDNPSRGIFGAARHFYPRSPCGERQNNVLSTFDGIKFLSTLSLRRATASITPTTSRRKNFYPRSPCGERL